MTGNAGVKSAEKRRGLITSTITQEETEMTMQELFDRWLTTLTWGTDDPPEPDVWAEGRAAGNTEDEIALARHVAFVDEFGYDPMPWPRG